MFTDIDTGRLACVAGVLLESKTENSYSLPRDCLEEFVDDELSKTAPLEVIHSYHLVRWEEEEWERGREERGGRERGGEGGRKRGREGRGREGGGRGRGGGGRKGGRER